MNRILTVALVGTIALASAPAALTQEYAAPIEQAPYYGVNGQYPNMAAYFSEARCPGDPYNDNPASCSFPQPRTASTPVNWRRCDWGSYGNAFYQCSDNVLSDDGTHVISTYSYAPWRQYTPAHGDGGQVIETDGLTARFTLTQDTSYGNAVIYGVGPECGADGWVLADQSHAPISGTTWTTSIDKFAWSIGSAAACPATVPSLDAWISETVTYPFSLGTTIQYRPVSTVISEHFDHSTVAQSIYAERNFFGYGYGLLIWEAWEAPSGTHIPAADLAQRCPVTSTGQDHMPPAPGWRLYDCRTLTQIVPSPGWTEDDNGWDVK